MQITGQMPVAEDERPPNRQQQRREASYRALIDSAMHQFHNRGYAVTTIQDIVELTPYTHGSFYHHFKNKEDCFWEVIAERENARPEWYRLPETLDVKTTSLEELLAQVFAGFAKNLQGLNVWVLVMVDFYQQHRGDPEVEERLAKVYGGWQRELRLFIETLRAGGWITKNSDPALLAMEIFAYQEGLAAHTSMYSIDRETFNSATVDGIVALLKRG